MRILITGVCGFVGSRLAEALIERRHGIEIFGLDNLSRPGSETNRPWLKRLGVKVVHGDLRQASDLESLPAADWVIDAAATPSVLAGVDGKISTRQLFEHNLIGTCQLLEFCKARKAGLILLSSSRVYSIPALARLPLVIENRSYRLDLSQPLPTGVSEHGIGPAFSTQPPISLYGSSKLASETIALEYGASFEFPVWIDRCGVLAGAGKFGTPDQGIFAYWINAHLRRVPLRYIGFGGQGYQTRDLFHPRDLAALALSQMDSNRADGRRVYTAGGGPGSCLSLAQLTAWCDARFGRHEPASDPGARPFDVPWVVMDSCQARSDFDWSPTMSAGEILEEIARHAGGHPDWLAVSQAL